MSYKNNHLWIFEKDSFIPLILATSGYNDAREA